MYSLWKENKNSLIQKYVCKLCKYLNKEFEIEYLSEPDKIRRIKKLIKKYIIKMEIEIKNHIIIVNYGIY